MVREGSSSHPSLHGSTNGSFAVSLRDNVLSVIGTVLALRLQTKKGNERVADRLMFIRDACKGVEIHLKRHCPFIYHNTTGPAHQCTSRQLRFDSRNQQMDSIVELTGFTGSHPTFQTKLTAGTYIKASSAARACTSW